MSNHFAISQKLFSIGEFPSFMKLTKKKLLKTIGHKKDGFIPIPEQMFNPMGKKIKKHSILLGKFSLLCYYSENYSLKLEIFLFSRKF